MHISNRFKTHELGFDTMVESSFSRCITIWFTAGRDLEEFRQSRTAHFCPKICFLSRRVRSLVLIKRRMADAARGINSLNLRTRRPLTTQ